MSEFLRGRNVPAEGKDRLPSINFQVNMRYVSFREGKYLDNSSIHTIPISQFWPNYGFVLANDATRVSMEVGNYS